MDVGCFVFVKSSVTSVGLLGPGIGGWGIGGRGGKSCWLGGTEKSGPDCDLFCDKCAEPEGFEGLGGGR